MEASAALLHTDFSPVQPVLKGFHTRLKVLHLRLQDLQVHIHRRYMFLKLYMVFNLEIK